MFPVLVAPFVGWIRPARAIGAVFSPAAPVRVQFNFTSRFLFLVTWLKALGTSRKKKIEELQCQRLFARSIDGLDGGFLARGASLFGGSARER